MKFDEELLRLINDEMPMPSTATAPNATYKKWYGFKVSFKQYMEDINNNPCGIHYSEAEGREMFNMLRDWNEADTPIIRKKYKHKDIYTWESWLENILTNNGTEEQAKEIWDDPKYMTEVY